MLGSVYRWKRFWCPRTGNLNLTDWGYLYDPDSEWGPIYNPDVVPFESIAETPCLVLLGEPGIGKTQALITEHEAVATKVKAEGGQTLWLDLCSYGNEDRLVRNLFECPIFQSWNKGDHTLHLFLDSLDECLLRLDNIAALLAEELRKYPVDRLRLRIACRTADWPNALEEALRQQWGDENVAVYELAPLRRVDVIEAARAASLDPDMFLSEIDNKEIVALAIKPVTLNFLINVYRHTSQFPSTQAELYQKGCRLLCEETNESRRDAHRVGTLSADQRIVVAARVAAIAIFGARYAVWTGVDRGDVPDVDVTISQLCGGTESTAVSRFEVTETAVREVLGTGLFSSRGPSRLGWAHQTYAEFLAARYLLHHEMALGQIMSLIVASSDPDRKVVPQLHEVSAWLAGMIPEVFQEIMRTDPQVVLRSDVTTADVQDRANLVEILLQRFDNEELIDRDFFVRRNYRKLAHPNLAEQLQPYISDRTKGVIVRRVATDIAEACELKSLQGDPSNLALDSSEHHEVRKNAAIAVSRIGDDETKLRLKPLAVGESGEDPDDGLKGCGLLAVWPRNLTSKELFGVLTPPKQPNLVGAYAMFLSSGLLPDLAVSDLPEALNWVVEQLPKHQLIHPFEDLVDKIMSRAWENLEGPGVLEAFAKAALSRLKQHDLIFGVHGRAPHQTTLTDDDKKRHLVLESTISVLSDPSSEAPLLVFSSTPIVMGADLPWMIEQLQSSQHEETQRAWAEVIALAFDLRQHDHPDVILQASQWGPILRERLAEFIEPVDIDSPEAQDMRMHYQERQEWLKRDEDRPLLEPPPAARITGLLDAFESGELSAWWRLNMEMTLKPDSAIYGNELQRDLTVLPGWEMAEPETRSRIVRAAKKYVLEQEPNTEEWLGKDIWHRPAIAGYRALWLLLLEEPIFHSEIPADTWKKWAPTILACPLTGGSQHEELEHMLVKTAYQCASAEIIEALLVLIDQENEKFNELFIIRKVSSCLDDRLANVLMSTAKEENLKPECMGSILALLLDSSLEEARTFAESLLHGLPHADDHLKSRAIVAGGLLMTHTENASWDTVWPAFILYPEFGRSVISNIDHRSGKIAERLTEDQLADLFIWVVGQYPYDNDTPSQRSRFLDVGHNISWLRNSLLNHLTDRGSLQACRAIRRIADEMPDLDWMKWTLQEAENITRSRTWVAVKPEHILKLGSDRQLRLVENGEQLLDILIESLRRLEQKLHGEVPASRDIWDENPNNNKYRPIQEEPFSDYLKRHLDEDIGERGIVVNREVRIHRKERTDLHVDAILPHDSESFRVVSAIIEVKGCWHQDLIHAMETQLVGRYLKDNHCQYGLYLVGWFFCDSWDNEDRRKSRVPNQSLDEAQGQFDNQAVALSQQGMIVKAFVMDTTFR